ncbi:MAG: carboxypeptidase-like regulatory domain-containing protein [Armatimonadetes bacterium]|nr:carboxypeptidase-like regulatory domain-containing protein [Armatimonadota bacterium]
MQSRVTAIVTLLFLAGVALFVWYLSSSGQEEVSKVVRTPRPVEMPRQSAVSVTPSEPKPPQRETPPETRAPDTADVTTTRVEGLVTTREGKPIKEAKVFEGSDTTNPRAQSDGLGRFVIESLSTSDKLLTVTHEKYVTATVPISPRGGETTQVRVTLAEAGSVEGSVTRGGVPAEGQVVKVARTGLSPSMPTGTSDEEHMETALRAVTDAQGHYVLGNLAVGEIRLEVRDSGADEDSPLAEWESASAAVEAGQTTVVNFDLPLVESAIEGVVLIEGQPPERASASAMIVCDYGRLPVGAEVQPDGSYRLERLPAGAVTLQVAASAAGGRYRRRSIEIELGEAQTVQSDFLFSAECAVYGTVAGILAGEEAAVIALTEFPSSAGELTFQDLIDISRKSAGECGVSPDGAFRIDGVDPGSYTILVVAFKRDAQQQIPQVRTTHKAVQLSAGAEVQVNLNLR